MKHDGVEEDDRVRLVEVSNSTHRDNNNVDEILQRTRNETLRSFAQWQTARAVVVAVILVLLPVVAYVVGKHQDASEDAVSTDELTKRTNLKVDHAGGNNRNDILGILSQYQQNGQEEKKSRFHGLDIYVIGFAKTGTGTLHDIFVRSEDVIIPRREYYGLFDGSAESALSKLDADFRKLPNSDVAKWAIKTPGAILNMTSINRLAKYTNRDTKLVLGLRHPVKWFQSKFNHRVFNACATGIGCERKHGSIPNPESLIGGVENAWRGIHTDLARFELYMKQLAKVDLSRQEMMEMGSWDLQVTPNSYKVFLYDTDQMADDDVDRARKFKFDFQMYLGLKDAINEWPQNKVNREKYPEEIDICDEQYKGLRRYLISQANATVTWIRDEFIQSEDVVVGGKEYFLTLLELWKTDVCQLEGR